MFRCGNFFERLGFFGCLVILIPCGILERTTLGDGVLFLDCGFGTEGLCLGPCRALLVGLDIVTPELLNLLATEEMLGLDGLVDNASALLTFFFGTTDGCLLLNWAVCFTVRGEEDTFCPCFGT